MKEVSINEKMKLSEHLASPSEAALSHSNELDGLRLSPHFTLGELTKTSYITTYWIHFAVRPKDNRRKILFDCR